MGIAAGGVLINNLTSVGDKKKSMNTYPWMGYSSGTYTEKEYTLSYVSIIIGGGLIVTSIPLSISGKKKIKKSVDIYNSEKDDYVNTTTYKVSLVTDNKGAGVRISF